MCLGWAPGAQALGATWVCPARPACGGKGPFRAAGVQQGGWQRGPWSPDLRPLTCWALGREPWLPCVGRWAGPSASVSLY